MSMELMLSNHLFGVELITILIKSCTKGATKFSNSYFTVKNSCRELQ